MDFFHYWIHRWRHRVRFLWPFHTIHHGANHLGILMGIRVHPIESIIIRILFLLPLLLLKELFGSVAWLSGVIYLYYAYCTHMDIPMSFGKFDKLLVSPLVHRIHHLTDFDKYSFNFAQMFSFWDVLFLTYMDPNYINDLLKKPLGIKEKRLFPSDENLVNANIFLIYWKQLLYPIKNYLKLIR
ncbi:MAG: sterol desaturase family protein [Oligoflexia bacterium]|nr:sterol desaturase family protein [Oligoflexia bacterium]